jgi:hypothetical protein
MTSTGDRAREAAARRLLERLRQRVVLSEGVGILQTWHLCGQQEARDDLRAVHGRAGQDTEATRIVAVVDADADGRMDPDGRWE